MQSQDHDGDVPHLPRGPGRALHRHRGLQLARRLARRGVGGGARLGGGVRLGGARLLHGHAGRGDALRAHHELRDGGFERGGVDQLLPRHQGPRHRVAELARGGEAIVATGGEGLHHEGLELGGDLPHVGAGWLHEAGPDDVEERLAAQAAVQGPTGEDLPEDDAQGVDVAPAVHLLAARLLGRHVAELALDDARLVVEELGGRDAEVGDLHRAFVGEQDVLRGDVAVDDLQRRAGVVLLLVGVVQALGGLGDHPRAEPRGDARALGLGAGHQHAEVRALDVFHREELPLVAAVVELEDLDDVGVVEARGELRLLDEHGAEASRGEVRRVDALDDEELVGALRAGLLREEDLGHSPRAQATHDVELGELAGGGRARRHGRVECHTPGPLGDSGAA